MNSINFLVIIFSFASFLFIVMSIFGSAIIILSIILTATIKKLKFIDGLILSMQLNDIFGAILNTIIQAVPYKLWNTSSIQCESFVLLNIIFMGCTVWHYVIISTHQYLRVIHGAKKLKSLLISFVICSRIIPMIVSVPSLIHLKSSNYTQSLFECSLAIRSKLIQSILILIVNALVPLILVTYCSVRIFLKVNF
jgi:hypothetical protein